MNANLTGGIVRSWRAPALLLLVVLVAAYFGVRWIMSEHLETLRSIPLFRGLSRRQLKPVLRAPHKTDLPPGQTIVTEGETGKSFFVITEGSATVDVGGTEVASSHASSLPLGRLELLLGEEPHVARRGQLADLIGNAHGLSSTAIRPSVTPAALRR